MSHPPRKIIIDTDPGQDDAVAILQTPTMTSDVVRRLSWRLETERRGTRQVASSAVMWAP